MAFQFSHMRTSSHLHTHIYICAHL